MRFHLLTLAAATLVGLGSAQALPLTNSAVGLKAAAEQSNLIEHVDACNRVCRKGAVEEWGGAVRWHRHVGKACTPVHCKP
jgi:hypothetical protein